MAPARGPQRRIVVLVAGAAVLLIVLLLAAAVALAPVIGRLLGDAFTGGGDEGGYVEVNALLQSPRMAWTADGRHAAVQICDERGVPAVLKYSAEASATDIATGFVLSEVEPTSPLAWLAPFRAAALVTQPVPVEHVDDEDAYEAPEDDYGIEFYSKLPRTLDTIYAPTGGLRWRLDVASAEPAAAGAGTLWGEWPAPVGPYRVRLKTGGANGRPPAQPEALVFSGGGPAERPGALPAYFSFRPLGWSPSGRYFAAVGVTRNLGGPINPRYDVVSHLVILSAEDGRIVSDVPLEPDDSYAGDDDFTYEPRGVTAAWDGRDDRLYFVRRYYAEDSYREYSVLMTLAPGGKPREATKEPGWDAPGEWEHAFDGWILGSDDDGPVVLFGTDGADDADDEMVTLHRLGRSGPVRVGKIVVSGTVTGGSVSRLGDMLLMIEDYEDSIFRLDLFDDYGGKGRAIWRIDMWPEESGV